MQVRIEQVLSRFPSAGLGDCLNTYAFVVERRSEAVAATVERERFDTGRLRCARPCVSGGRVGDVKGIRVSTEIGEGDEKVRW